MNNPLEDFRDEIDKIDSEIVSAIAGRVAVVQKVSQYKKANNIPPLDPKRWAKVIDKVTALAEKHGVDDQLLKDVYDRIHQTSLELEGHQKVYYLGPEGSYSHMVSLKMFPEDRYMLIPCESFHEIREKIVNSDGFGVLPIENSITSNVHENVDALYSGKLQIIGEGYLDIRLDLITTPGANLAAIQGVYSHPKALEQCSNFIKENQLSSIETSSTSDAIKKILADKSNSIAAIGSGEFAKGLGLDVIEENIGNVKSNQTRFLVVTSDTGNPVQSEKDTKITLLLKLKHEVGSLAKTLSLISAAGGNLSKIESRPIPESKWSYSFILDIESDQLDKVIDALESECEEVKVLGRYNLLTAN